MLSVSFSVAINPQPKSTRIAVLFAGQSQTQPHHDVGPQVHDNYLIHHVVSGKGSFQCGGKKYHLGPGECFTIFPGELVSYTSDGQDPWFYRWIAFKGDYSEELLGSIGITPQQPCAVSKRPRRSNAIFHTTEQILRKNEPGSDLRSSAYLMLSLAEYDDHEAITVGMKKTTAAQQLVERAILWLSLQYSRQISIEEMANELGYHRTHLSKIFKQETGMSPMNYLMKIRMERAAHLLVHESFTIQQVASSVGYSDPLYFSKQFKKWYGTTPSRFTGK